MTLAVPHAQKTQQPATEMPAQPANQYMFIAALVTQQGHGTSQIAVSRWMDHENVVPKLSEI